MPKSNQLGFCVTWNDKVDLDLHCKLPDGTKCYSSNKRPTNYVGLDVDKREHDLRNQVENILLDLDKCVDGVYKIYVRYNDGHGRPCHFQFLFNDRSQYMYTGYSISNKRPRDTEVLKITVKGG